MMSFKDTLRETKSKPKRGYWYMRYIRECVLCGAGEDRKERMYTPKPEKHEDRVDYTQFACWSHFV